MLRIKSIDPEKVTITWTPFADSMDYRIFWSDKNSSTSQFVCVGHVFRKCEFTFNRSTSVPHYLKVVAGNSESEIIETPISYYPSVQLEKLGRGLIAITTTNGVFLSWRFLKGEVISYNSDQQSLTGKNFTVFRNGQKIAYVDNSTNYLDCTGQSTDTYQVAADLDTKCAAVQPWPLDHWEIPLRKPTPGKTPTQEEFVYHANDLSVMDVDGDGAYEFILKWDPSNSHDVSQRGYTGRCLIDCYRLDGQLLWRIDCGDNIRSGAHYTQFMCYDFDGDGRGEIVLKTAPGTSITRYQADGSEQSTKYISIPQDDVLAGVSHHDNYVNSASDYSQHLTHVFKNWTNQAEVRAGNWPTTLEECFGVPVKYKYPLSDADARELTDYFLDVYAPSRSSRNQLREFEGFIFSGPEYLTVFSGLGEEIDTIPFPFPRGDDGLSWGDYAGPRIEPCNRVDRFLAGVAYLDGVHPSLIISRGYYTRTCVAALDLRNSHLDVVWKIDSGHVPMNNPFNDTSNNHDGIDPFYGKLASQGDHAMVSADIDGDGKMEIVFGAATIDSDGSILYSSQDRLPNGKLVKLGHGDALHVADIDPDRPGKEIFNVFEGAGSVPFGYALRRAEDGTTIFGTYEPTRDLGRCMVGDVLPERGLQCWVNQIGTFDARGHRIAKKTLGTNMSIRFSEDFSTQIVDGVDYLANDGTGIINDFRHGVVLKPVNTKTNNGTKGNPCLVADIFGDYREELILRQADDCVLHIYSNTEVSQHKLFSLMQDVQYRVGIAGQNDCYNQPCYPSFYYASDLEAADVLPNMRRKPAVYLAGDSTMQSYADEQRPQFGWGELLLSELEPDFAIKTGHRASCEHKQEKYYENQHLIIDNCSMAGRSTKSFIAENRLNDIAQQIRSGDYLLIQFGHNDANKKRDERHVPLADFPNMLSKFVAIAREHQAEPLLVTPISICPVLDQEKAQELSVISKDLDRYAVMMKRYADEKKIRCIDIHQISQDYFATKNPQEVKTYYRADGVHLNERGAQLYAGFVAAELQSIPQFHKL